MHQAWQIIVDSYSTTASWKLYAVVALMFVNWGIEAKKWQILVAGIQKIAFFRAFRAIFTGQAVALNTFNGIGEYVGRVVYLKDGNRLRAIALSIVGSLSQLIITLVMGLIGLVYVRLNILDEAHHLQGLSKFWLDAMMYSLSFLTVIFLFIYFQMSWLTKLMEKIPFVAKYSFYIQKLEDFHYKELTKILLLSFFRYVVFVVQYLLLLQLFQVEASIIQLAWVVCVLFLVLAVVPSIPVAELGLRGEVSRQLFGLLSANILGIIFTAAIIWVINRVIPAIAGSLFILGVKLFKK
ncbi:MAG: flippase-like domain-containing protein [Chitinophagaceae bacterium]|nr:flippase-like domain-containing protein [Chitinophagaceae bacterium]MCW5906147.1 flippase-like domain-containing protein [Chitinophagaceae bacterium]